MQILVKVANTQVKALETEVEKGSTSTLFERGLVDPKTAAHAYVTIERLSFDSFNQSKGKLVNIPVPGYVFGLHFGVVL